MLMSEIVRICGYCPDCQGPENFRQYCQNNSGGCGVHIDGNFAEVRQGLFWGSSWLLTSETVRYCGQQNFRSIARQSFI